MAAGLIPERQMFRKTQERSAVSYLVDTLEDSDGDITVIAAGPLTNIAMAMRANPDIIGKIKKLVIMGGGHLRPFAKTPTAFSRCCAANFAHIQRSD